MSWFQKNIIDKRLTVIGLEICITSIAEQEYRWTESHLLKGEFEVKETLVLNEADFLFRLKKNKHPISLSVEGKGQIHKILEERGMRNEDLVSHILPGADSRDFFIQKTDFGSKLRCSLMRKTELEQLISTLRGHSVRVVDIHLGQFQSSYFARAIAQETIRTEESIFCLQEGALSFNKNTQSSDISYTLGEYDVAQKFIPSVANALAWLSRNESAEPILDHVLESRAEERYRQYAARLALFGLALILVSLLTNYFMYQKLSEQYASMEYQSQENSALFSKVESLKTQTSQNQNLVAYFGSGLIGRSSFFADRLASTVPDGLELLKMEVFSQEEQKKKDDKLQFSKTLKVKGALQQEGNFNDWMIEVKGLEWVKGISVDQFERNERRRRTEFEISISL